MIVDLKFHVNSVKFEIYMKFGVRRCFWCTAGIDRKARRPLFTCADRIFADKSPFRRNPVELMYNLRFTQNLEFVDIFGACKGLVARHGVVYSLVRDENS